MFRFTFSFDSCRKVETENRKITTNNSSANKRYGNNKIVNSKYTWYSFVPLILLAHICRFMNFYFILIGGLQMWNEVSPVNPLTTWIPIILIFAIAFVREGIDDISQHKQDYAVNHRKFCIIRDKKLIEVKAEDILCGDFVVVNKNEICPVDMAIVLSSEDDGTCSLETANLDGETSLKTKNALTETQALGEDGLKNAKIKIECPPANADLNKFDGTLTLNGNVYPLSTSNFIQFGTTIKNADLVYGIACYTGNKTKIGMNSKTPPVKWTQIEQFIDKCSISIFVFQFILAVIWGLVGNSKMSEYKANLPYLRLDINKGTQGYLLYFRAYLLTSIMIPISLKVTLDICKYVYATWIRNDARLYDRTTHQRPLVNNTSVIEDLGAVEYIFTDKTGTLTENKMKLQKIVIGNTIYGASESSEDIYGDTTLTDLFLQNKEDQNRTLGVFFMSCLGLCHAAKDTGTEEEPNYESFSSEETCFLNALHQLEVNVQINYEEITIESQKYGIEPTSYHICAILPFSTDIRRMTVVVKNRSTNEYFLFSKGSSETISSFASNSTQEYLKNVSTFASLGLRVMAISYRALSNEEFKNFIDLYNVAQRTMDDRVVQITRAFETIEHGQTILGITGIEDQLQIDVPETIAMMRGAGIKIWMVTGDMKETAIKVAHTSGLITKTRDIFDITSPSGEASPYEILKELDTYISSVDVSHHPVYIIIDGSQPLANEYLEKYGTEFAKVASKASCVICARTMPKQKAQYVRLIQKMKKVTLAVGDGGNDVTMLRESHIGVGIMGLEGTQASVASDFAIKQFFHLQRLLLIHGRFAAYRTSWLVQFCFYKSFMLSIIQVSFNFWNGFTASSFISDFNLMCYNAIFTLLPVIFFLFDKDVEDDTVYLHPYLYSDSRAGTFCNVRSMFWWVFKGLYQAIVIVVIVHFCIGHDLITLSDGSPISLSEMQQTAYSSAILNVLFTVTFDTQQFTSLNFIFIWGNWFLYILCTIVANMIPNLTIVSEMYLAVWRTYANPALWMITITATSFSILPVVFFNSMFTTYLPTRAQTLRFREIKKQSKFEPAYEVTQPGKSKGRVLEETVWDKTHNICSPLCHLCCL